jgi:hypothetical protein
MQITIAAVETFVIKEIALQYQLFHQHHAQRLLIAPQNQQAKKIVTYQQIR